MRFAYLTRDEVNRDLARTFASEHKIELEIYDCFETFGDGEFNAILCDHDSFPADEQNKGLTALAIGSKSKATAVHSYNLDDQQRRFLHRNSVLTVRRLRRELFDRLSTMVQQKSRTQTVA